jgi:hypothetical protein
MALSVNNAANIALKAQFDLAEISASGTYLQIGTSVELDQTKLS